MRVFTPKTGRNTDLPARTRALATAASARAPMSVGVIARGSGHVAGTAVIARGRDSRSRGSLEKWS
jgi:hypothetical protein